LQQLPEKVVYGGEVGQSLALRLLRRLVTSGHASVLGEHGETETADVDEGVDVVGCETMACLIVSN
jgi:hypothetical protein